MVGFLHIVAIEVNIMDINDFIVDGRLNADALENLKKTVKYTEKIRDDNTSLYFANAFAYVENYDNGEISNYILFDTNKNSALFDREKKLRIRKNCEKDITEIFNVDGQTLEEINCGNGCHIKFCEDGKSLKQYKKDKDADIVYLDKIQGQLLADKSLKDIELLLPLVAQLPTKGIKLCKDNFINELAIPFDTKKLPLVSEGYKVIYRPNVIHDEDINHSIKDLGIQIERRILDVFVEFDEVKNEYIFKDKDGKIITRSIGGYADSTGIKIRDWRFILKEQDYQKLEKLNSDIKIAVENADEVKQRVAKWDVLEHADKSLMALYLDLDILDDKTNVLLVLSHEAKHIMNGILCGHRAFASDYKKPSAEKQYKLDVEEERSAYFEELNKAITKYFTNGENLNDAFGVGFLWVINKLEGCDKKEITEKLYPPQNIMNEALQDWNDYKLEAYFGQIQDRCFRESCESLLVPIDETEDEYKKQLSFKYTYEVYNPYTQTVELLDLSPAIKVDIPITDKVREEIIKPSDEKREKAQQELDKLFPDEKTKAWSIKMVERLQHLAVAMSVKNIDDLKNIQEWAKSATPVKLAENVSENAI